MSSSAERHLWDGFEERPVPRDVDQLTPVSELAAVLQRYRADLDAERERATDSADAVRDVAVTQALLVHRLAVILSRDRDALSAVGLHNVHRGLSGLHCQMQDALEQFGLAVVDPTGDPLDGLIEAVEVISRRHGPQYAGEVVAETLEPIVLLHGEVTRRGRVIAGAPATDEPAGAPTSQGGKQGGGG